MRGGPLPRDLGPGAGRKVLLAPFNGRFPASENHLSIHACGIDAILEESDPRQGVAAPILETSVLESGCHGELYGICIVGDAGERCNSCSGWVNHRRRHCRSVFAWCASQNASHLCERSLGRPPTGIPVAAASTVYSPLSAPSAMSSRIGPSIEFSLRLERRAADPARAAELATLPPPSRPEHPPVDRLPTSN